ncbi:unnamed protein product, partial [Vitis vinifera]
MEKKFLGSFSRVFWNFFFFQNCTRSSLGHQEPSNERIPKKALFSSATFLKGPPTRESLKRLYFPLPLSILAENPCKTPKENRKTCFFLAPCVFWICSTPSLLLCHSI